MHCVPTGFRKGLEASIIICSVIGCNTMLKGGSRHFDLGGLYNGKSRNLMKIQAPLGGSGGMPPQEILTYSCSETASGAI